MISTSFEDALNDIARRRYESAREDEPWTFTEPWEALPEHRNTYAGLCKSGWRDAVAPILREFYPMLQQARQEGIDSVEALPSAQEER